MSLRFAVVHEADSAFRTATELADRVMLHVIEWLDENLLGDQREWVGEASGGRRLSWTGLKQLAREAGVRSHGHFDGQPGLPDAAAARRAIDYLLSEVPDLKAIVLIRDRDGEPERRAGLEQARGQERSGIVIVLGLAIVERECWVLSGYDPQNEAESERLEAVRQQLGFDPRYRSHELTACKNDQARRSPKRVLREMSGGDPSRERLCWRETAVATLRERGSENGLTEYLQEIQNKLASLIGHPS